MFEKESALIAYIGMIFNGYFIGSVLPLCVPNIYQPLGTKARKNLFLKITKVAGFPRIP
jgi:hypothetical protein